MATMYNDGATDQPAAREDGLEHAGAWAQLRSTPRADQARRRSVNGLYTNVMLLRQGPGSAHPGLRHRLPEALRRHAPTSTRPSPTTAMYILADAIKRAGSAGRASRPGRPGRHQGLPGTDWRHHLHSRPGRHQELQDTSKVVRRRVPAHEVEPGAHHGSEYNFHPERQDGAGDRGPGTGCWCGCWPGRPGPDRHQGRLRRRPVRRLHGAGGRRAGALMLHPPGGRGRQIRAHHRGAGQGRRTCTRCSAPSRSTTPSSAATAPPAWSWPPTPS